MHFLLFQSILNNSLGTVFRLLSYILFQVPMFLSFECLIYLLDRRVLQFLVLKYLLFLAWFFCCSFQHFISSASCFSTCLAFLDKIYDRNSKAWSPDVFAKDWAAWFMTGLFRPFYEDNTSAFSQVLAVQMLLLFTASVS